MEVLRRAMKALNIDDSPQRMDAFSAYRDLVLEWNEKVNLTAIKDPHRFPCGGCLSGIFKGEEDYRYWHRCGLSRASFGYLFSRKGICFNGFPQ